MKSIVLLLLVIGIVMISTGYQKSIYTGYCYAKGDLAFQFDCDMQDPSYLFLD